MTRRACVNKYKFPVCLQLEGGKFISALLVSNNCSSLRRKDVRSGDIRQPSAIFGHRRRPSDNRRSKLSSRNLKHYSNFPSLKTKHKLRTITSFECKGLQISTLSVKKYSFLRCIEILSRNAPNSKMADSCYRALDASFPRCSSQIIPSDRQFGITPNSKMAVARDDLERAARKRGIEGQVNTDPPFWN